MEGDYTQNASSLFSKRLLKRLHSAVRAPLRPAYKPFYFTVEAFGVKKPSLLPLGDRIRSVFGHYSPSDVFPADVVIYKIGVFEEISSPHHDDILRSCCYPCITLTVPVGKYARFCLWWYVRQFMG